MSLGDHFGLFSDPGEVFGSSPRVPREIVPDFGGTWCYLVLIGARIWTAASRS
jgi:hypothetical protein